MAAQKRNTFSSEVSSRLSEFFEDSGPENADSAAVEQAAAMQSAFTNLNALLLSIEWEITDDILTKLLGEIEQLKQRFEGDKILLSFLQLLGSVGKYIRSKKVMAHPDSIKLLESVHGGLDRILESPESSEAEKKQIVAIQVQKFKELKEQILLAKKEPEPASDRPPSPQPAAPGPAPPAPAAADQEPAAPPPFTEPPTPPSPQPAPAEDHADLRLAIEEIKTLIKAEFNALREELKRLSNRT